MNHHRRSFGRTLLGLIAALIATSLASTGEAQQTSTPAGEVAPVQITADAPVPPPPGSATPGDPGVVVSPASLGPVAIGVAQPTTVLHVVSAAGPLDVALYPSSLRLPPPDFIQYGCRTPCALSPPSGSYRLITRSASGVRMTRTVTLTGSETTVRVTPRLALAPRIAAIAAGAGLFIGGTTVAVQLAYYSTLSLFSSANFTPYIVGGVVVAVIGAGLAIGGGMAMRGAFGRIETRTARGRIPAVTFAALPMPGGVFVAAGLNF